MVYGVADTPVLAHDVLVTPAEKGLRSGQPNILPVPIDIPLPVPHPDRCQPMLEFPGTVELRVNHHLTARVDIPETVGISHAGAEKGLRSGQPNILPVPIDIPLPVP